eukprot:12940046-Alexandrium_andersonii.AAC.1
MIPLELRDLCKQKHERVVMCSMVIRARAQFVRKQFKQCLKALLRHSGALHTKNIFGFGGFPIFGELRSHNKLSVSQFSGPEIDVRRCNCIP